MTSFPSDKMTLIGSCHSDKVKILYLLQDTHALESFWRNSVFHCIGIQSENFWPAAIIKSKPGPDFENPNALIEGDLSPVKSITKLNLLHPTDYPNTSQCSFPELLCRTGLPWPIMQICKSQKSCSWKAPRRSSWPTLCWKQGLRLGYPRSCQAKSWISLIDSTASLGNLSQCPSGLTVKKLFLKSR